MTFDLKKVKNLDVLIMYSACETSVSKSRTASAALLYLNDSLERRCATYNERLLYHSSNLCILCIMAFQIASIISWCALKCTACSIRLRFLPLGHRVRPQSKTQAIGSSRKQCPRNSLLWPLDIPLYDRVVRWSNLLSPTHYSTVSSVSETRRKVKLPILYPFEP